MKWLPQEDYLQQVFLPRGDGKPEAVPKDLQGLGDPEGQEGRDGRDLASRLFPDPGRRRQDYYWPVSILPPPPPWGALPATIPRTYFQEPLARVEGELGGISLEAATTSPTGLGLENVVGAVWDARTGNLVLLGEDSQPGNPWVALPPLQATDLAVAFKSVLQEGRYPAFSLDPADPENPRGPYLKPVFYGPVAGTSFGQALFDADWKQKEYSFGVRRTPGGGKEEIDSGVAGYRDTFDLSFAQGRKSGETFMRFWIICDEVPLYRGENALFFGPVRMRVNTEEMFLTARGLTSSGGRQNPAAEEFAAHFTTHYDKFAREEPAFARLKELAKAVALAGWLQKQGIPVDLD